MTNKPSMQRKSSIAPTPSKQPVSKFDTHIFILLSTVCQIWTQVAKKLKPPQTTSWPTTCFLQHNLRQPFVAMARHSRTYIRLQQQEMLRVPQLKLSELTWDTGAGSYNIRIAKDLAHVATWLGYVRIHFTRYVLKGKWFAKTTTLHTTINHRNY